MRDKDIEKLLSDGAKDVLPDDRVKQNIKSSLGYDENKAQKLAIVGGGEAVSCRRNIIIAACAAALAVILAICFIVPAIIGRDNPFGHGGITDGNKFDGITDANSFYAYGAASVGTMRTFSPCSRMRIMSTDSQISSGLSSISLKRIR